MSVRMLRSVYDEIARTIGQRKPECGGVLGAGKDGIITEFFFDAHGVSSSTGYAPDVENINRVLSYDWMPRGIMMVGIVHSHANGVAVPSCMDIGYGIRILRALDTVDKFYLPIVTVVDGDFKMSCFSITKDTDGRCVCKKGILEITKN